MAAAETAPPPLSIPQPQIEPLSDDDGSSPLSDAPPDHTPAAIDGGASPQSSDDELSDANDTEAETERLYDTPKVPTRQKDVVLNEKAEGRVYERTPSKLRHQDRTNTHDDDDDDEDDNDDEPLSDADVSMASSPPAHGSRPPAKLPSPSLDLLAEAAKHEAESRKRKRSSAAADVETEQPLRKRTGSVQAPDADRGEGEPGSGDEDEDVDPTPQSRSGDHSADDTPTATATGSEHDRPHTAKTRKHTRSGSRRLREQEAAAAAAAVPDEHDPTEDTLDGTGPDEEAGHTGDDEPMADEADEEAEAAHRNEEELERKKAAYDQLAEIEKRFASFREKLFEERMEQLNREEAMLRADEPTHPEYLAMMECVEARRNERTIIADRTFTRTMETIDRWAVARRAQIHSQYFQSVRESRERVLAELGQRWYDIQHERRKNANNVPEFGLRFPPTSQQRVRQAIAYNKEVSILSGIAKYEGMPAAPDMRGASSQELEDDFEAINLQRSRVRAPQPRLVRPSYAEYGGLPFGQGLGPAGEQFLEQTPWANPNHPAHGAPLAQRQQSQALDGGKPTVATTTPAPKRNSQKPVPMSAGTISNASNHSPVVPTPSQSVSKASKGAPRNLSTSPEVARAASLLEQTSARSMRAMSGTARPMPPKNEQLPAIGGRS
ncbi:Sds3-like-domain-containing protein [Microdochium trichocladiopsis]|uniref:Sds3-like-domain-containing protein n=1 Tax=Microdochium trichocladiopsis TaxID=1682393 RepID=A0A9P8Y3E7_9PEZI|nr:Sds3-like-domain-containing protein [Microdochium trichocladiopsis]KAH7026467.1 Sds3-like-domain-containing protein [Microdochium trichocladiopsis]